MEDTRYMIEMVMICTIISMPHMSYNVIEKLHGK